MGTGISRDKDMMKCAFVLLAVIVCVSAMAVADDKPNNEPNVFSLEPVPQQKQTQSVQDFVVASAKQVGMPAGLPHGAVLTVLPGSVPRPPRPTVDNTPKPLSFEYPLKPDYPANPDNLNSPPKPGDSINPYTLAVDDRLSLTPSLHPDPRVIEPPVNTEQIIASTGEIVVNPVPDVSIPQFQQVPATDSSQQQDDNTAHHH
eukprot:c7577_g1_i2.p1 GENE.c7577_g1_i2~~c7577_g1_i2.p1  ORF type:complete len:202 (+),score=72.16 c7577_g1_i2:1-606(+)